jgi:hypothetical protein
MRDHVTLVKQDGRRFENLLASVQREKIFTNNASIPIEEGDVFERTLPSGVLERYTVLDAGYYERTGGIESHYQSVVRKQTRIDPPRQPTHVVYNLIGPNARINIQSVDASTNLVQIEPSDLFAKLQATVREGIPDAASSSQLLRKIEELEEAQGTSDFVARYREFMALAADHVTVLAPFIPALSQMLS